MSARVYLDWNATAPLRIEAKAAMAAAMEVAGNPSSVHAEGRAARALVERARAEVAAAVGCAPAEVVFTSGATEAAMVLERLGAAGRVVVEPTAHDALWSHQGAGGGEPAVFAMGLANSETGMLSEVPAKDAGGWVLPDGGRARTLLLDVTQAVGRVPFAFGWSGADVAVLSAHKFGGPKGVGALILREGLEIGALCTGGGQESGRRAGTENIVGIAGMAAAARAAARDLADGVWDRVAGLRDRMEAAMRSASPGTIFVGQGGARLANTLCAVTPGWKGETQVMRMDLEGFAVSAGSACSSGKVRPSRVLTAMGFDAVAAASAVRVSIGPSTGEDEAMRFAEAWGRAAAKARTGAKAA
ncbi:MAG: cysteine desulfurase family protein [Paracoccaceae bacterium]